MRVPRLTCSAIGASHVLRRQRGEKGHHGGHDRAEENPTNAPMSYYMAVRHLGGGCLKMYEGVLQSIYSSMLSVPGVLWWVATVLVPRVPKAHPRSQNRPRQNDRLASQTCAKRPFTP